MSLGLSILFFFWFFSDDNASRLDAKFLNCKVVSLSPSDAQLIHHCGQAANNDPLQTAARFPTAAVESAIFLIILCN